MSSEDEKPIYKECQNCHAMDYDNADWDAEYDNNDRLIVRPKKCDKCDFELMLSDSSELH